MKLINRLKNDLTLVRKSLNLEKTIAYFKKNNDICGE